MTDRIRWDDDHREAVAGPLFRLRIEPDETNGLSESYSLMVDKITTVPRSKLGDRIGKLDDEELVRLGRAIMVFFGLAG